MSEETVAVNRAPVLTLWAAVVAERQGYDWDAALSLGRAVAGLNAQAKGRAIGIFHPRPPTSAEEARRAARPAEFRVQICGRTVPARQTPAGVRAVSGDKPIDPDKVEEYLARAFGNALPAVRRAMEELASTYPPERLEDVSYDLYERFRPSVAAGQRGWGQKGILDLSLVRSLAGEA